MDFLSILLISIGLSMDCFAVAVSGAIADRGAGSGDGLKMATSFGLFQALMPVAGWMAGISMQNFIQKIDHWIAFSLLAFVGLKMIISSFGKEEKTPAGSFFAFYHLMLLSIATSIDALAVGLSFGLLGAHIIMPMMVIGVVSFSITLFGCWVGKKSSGLIGKRMEVVGGLILIGIGLKIVFEHFHGHL